MTEATIRSALLRAASQLNGSASPQLDAEILLAHSLNQSRSHLFAWPDKELSEQQLRAFHELLIKRASGMPIAYLTGEREFWSLPLKINESVLIPRADTETLVETALSCLPETGTALDLGTGSGAIALALASERPKARILASDASNEALSVAKDNAKRLELNRIEFILSDWFKQISQRTFDLIVSNPPYIEENDPHLSQGDLPHEPRSALVSGSDGLDDIRQIIKDSYQRLKPAGWLMLEHGYNQGDSVRELFISHNFQEVRTISDYYGNDRVSIGKR